MVLLPLLYLQLTGRKRRERGMTSYHLLQVAFSPFKEGSVTLNNMFICQIVFFGMCEVLTNRQSIDLFASGFVFIKLLLEPFWSCMLKKQMQIIFYLNFGTEWSLLSNYQFSDLGRIWIIYKAPTRARVFCVDLQSVTCEISLEDGNVLIYNAVYASNEEEERRKLWSSLRNTEVKFGLSNRPWMINGDFNEILCPAETSNDNIVCSTRGMRLFGDCLADLSLFDLPFRGPKFTWTNKRSVDHIGKKLDRCLVNGCWLSRFPTSHCTFEAPEFSDHTPCHIQLVTPPPSYGSRPFKFFCLLTKHPKFMDVVMDAWVQVGVSVSSLKDFCFKLKKMKAPLKTLMKDNFSGLEKRVIEAHLKLNALQLFALNDPSPVNLQNELIVKEVWMHLSLAEESFFKQKSRLRWLGEGDFNTSFFHKVSAARSAGNAIKLLLKPDGSVTSSLQEVHELVVDHFAGILCTIKGRFCPQLAEFLSSLIQTTCSVAHQSSLAAPFSDEAIKTCLFKMPRNKTPGPDGFPTEFFKSTWSIIGHDLTLGVRQFFLDSFIPSALNSTSLVLIPKRPGAIEVKDFRPISCLNTVYKIISRLLVDRLKVLLPDLILPNQTAFVKGRLLMENVLLASEVMQGYHLDSGKERITLKVDIAKAFDSVRHGTLFLALFRRIRFLSSGFY
ncbi:Reverse transcriptase domain [Arabidopsis suecica]|uniref:Reverse transcriptase domain n=1 Tax=Arabidopsis suecica TaxID=45249 RepID=A0A8T1ZSY4_ARASU|nr:Reverse transcriptase domain [Arabidopsis suecica]